MPVFVQTLWGYQLTVPADWQVRSFADVEGFAPDPKGLEADASGPGSGHVLVHAEWNPYQVPVEPLWQAHIARVASVVGARQLGASPWAMGGGAGLEAEIVLPKKDGRRLWAGILSRGAVALKFMVAHPVDDREWFQPVVTETLKTLRFLDRVTDVPVHASGLPLPPKAREIDPDMVLIDSASDGWAVFETPHSIGGLQAFYWRESPAHGWRIDHFEPYPGNGEVEFARAGLERAGVQVALGLIPYRSQASGEAWLGRIAFKITQEA